MPTQSIILERLSFTDLGEGPFQFSLTRAPNPNFGLVRPLYPDPNNSSFPFASLVDSLTQPPDGTPERTNYPPMEEEVTPGHDVKDLPNGIWRGRGRLWARGSGLLVVTPLGEPLATAQGTSTVMASLARGTGPFDISKIKNDGSQAIFIGGPDVTPANGWPIAAGAVEDVAAVNSEIFVVSLTDQPYAVLSC